jgi:hypothetical protein
MDLIVTDTNCPFENSADFTHNITDGLAMSASFYASPTIGATTTVAVFFHEIPHEVGDFALLVQSGFSKRAAMGSQFVTAIGALLGTLIGIAVQEFGGAGVAEDGDAGMPRNSGLWGTSLVSFSSSSSFSSPCTPLLGPVYSLRHSFVCIGGEEDDSIRCDLRSSCLGTNC